MNFIYIDHAQGQTPPFGDRVVHQTENPPQFAETVGDTRAIELSNLQPAQVDFILRPPRLPKVAFSHAILFLAEMGFQSAGPMPSGHICCRI